MDEEQRKRVFFQLLLRAAYKGEGRIWLVPRPARIKETFAWELETLGTDYADFGFLHCVDEDADYDKLEGEGILDYARELKAAEKIRHIGFFSSTATTAFPVLRALMWGW